MTADTHLTNDLQAELNKIASPVRLQTDTNFIVKLNYKDWAWADTNFRQIEASTFVGLDDKHLQLEERGIIACTASTKDIKEIAVIINKWLDKHFDVFRLAKEHFSIKINERYKNLKILPVQEVLSLRWTHLAEEIANGTIDFSIDVFEKFREHFSTLFPFFSHDNLWFSNILELPNEDFKSPFIICSGRQIEVGLILNNSQANNSFKTFDIEEAIQKTKELLPRNIKATINPLDN